MGMTSKPEKANHMRYFVRVYCDGGKPMLVDPDKSYPDMDFVALILGRDYTRMITRKYETPIPGEHEERVLYWYWDYADRLEALSAVEELARAGYSNRISLVPVPLVAVAKTKAEEKEPE